jgi:hypothetical protein
MLSKSPMAWLAALSLACASSAPAPPSQLQFLDSELFDEQLHDSLDYGHGQVVVRLAGSDVTVNQIPERLDLWFAAVARRYKGQVEVLPDPDLPTGRGLTDMAVSFVVGTYKVVRDRVRYSAARGYDAKVFFAPADGAITRIVFTRRPEA